LALVKGASDFVVQTAIPAAVWYGSVQDVQTREEEKKKRRRIKKH
jgi:hypothetical protein